MKIVFLDSGTFYGVPDLQAILSKYGELELYPYTSSVETLKRLKGCEVVLTNKVVISRDMMEVLPDLRLICITATGTNNVDTEFAAKVGIQVKNVKGYSTASVAQITLGMVLHLVNKISFYDKYVKMGSYSSHHFFTHLSVPFSEIEGKKWGVIGLGSIGLKVADIANAVGANVLFHSPSGKASHPVYSACTLEELLKQCDIVTIHTPLSPLTHHLINSKNLCLMKPNAILINVARGGIVQEDALANALREGLLAGAGSDVFSHEPPPIDNPLLASDIAEKIVLAPHVAWGSVESRQRLISQVCVILDQYLKGAS